jgi:DNA-binding MarR family transcriptional regulator
LDENPTDVDRLGKAFQRLGRHMTSVSWAHLEVAPGPLLSGSQRTVLRSLVDHGPAQVSEVAALLEVTLSAVTGMIDRLVKAELVTRERDEADRRVVWVRVTPDGESALIAAEERYRAALSHFVRHLPTEDLATLCDILERLG